MFSTPLTAMGLPARAATAAVLLAVLSACNGSSDVAGPDVPTGPTNPTQPPAAVTTQIAFMPDVHFHDVYANFEDGSFPGVPNPKNGKNATIRLMQAQMTSTRLFNENYFAFITALDDAVKRGVKFIALPGDFSDDGQPVNMRGLQKVLDEYSKKYGIEFFAAPGNHDPNRPKDMANGKSDYLGLDPNDGSVGFPQPIYSRGGNNDCKNNYSGSWSRQGWSYCTEEVRYLGYEGIVKYLDQHGLSPKQKYRYYATPYSTYSYKDYSFDKAKTEATWDRRQYEICKEGAGGSYKQAGYTFCKKVYDTSYVVEPVEGVWLVGIDANVYIPTGAGDNDFTGSGDNGYNAMLTHKPHVIAWLKDVVARGKAEGKQVVAFSHFPMGEFFNDASDEIMSLLGDRKMQMVRRPKEDVTKALAETGLKVHIGGHMHFNDTGVRKYANGDALFNIQAPSMAAYVPAYKLLSLNNKNKDEFEITTVRLDNVDRFDELFDLYRAEHNYFTRLGFMIPDNKPLWDKSILNAKNYGDFNTRYMSELVRLRLLDDDWRCEMRELVKSPLYGSNMLVLSQLDTQVSLADLAHTANHGQLSNNFFNCLEGRGESGNNNPAYAADYARAEAKARQLAIANGMRLEDFNEWKAIDLAGDFVRLANAGDLAFQDIPASRAKQYKLLADALSKSNATLQMSGDKVRDSNSLGALFQARFNPLMKIMTKLANGAPTQHFTVNVKTNELVDLSGQKSPL